MKCLNLDTCKWGSWGMLGLRVVTGLVFLLHGIQKFNGLDGTTRFFQGLEIPMASVMAIVVATVETLGGVALIAGIFTGIGSILLAIVMTVAIFTVHISKGFGSGGVEFPLLLIASLFAIYTNGPGALALAGCCCKDNCKSGCDTKCKDGACTPTTG